MTATLKERVYVLPIEFLDENSYDKVHVALRQFLEKRMAGYVFSEEWQKIPVVARPRMTVNGDEPDWSQLKLAVRNVAIFRDGAARVLIQLTEKFISINSLFSIDDESPASLEALNELYERFIEFFDEDVLRLVKPLSILSEVYYVFGNDCLDSYVIERDKREYPYFLDIQSIMRSGVLPRLPMEMTPPLRQESHYRIVREGNEFSALVNFDIGCPNANPKNGWRFALDLKVDGHVLPRVENRFGFGVATSDLEEVLKECAKQIFADDAVKRLGVVV